MMDFYDILLAQKLSGGGGGGGGLKPILEGTIESLDFTATSITEIIPRVDMPSDYQASGGDVFLFVAKKKGASVYPDYIGGAHLVFNNRTPVSYGDGGGASFSRATGIQMVSTRSAAASSMYGISCSLVHSSSGDFITINGRYSSSTGTMKGDYEYKLYRITNLLA